MARSSNLSHRIERLFNDGAFRQAFTASRRTLATALLVPVVLFAAATFVRVTAAAQTPEQTAPAAESDAGHGAIKSRSRAACRAFSKLRQPRSPHPKPRPLRRKARQRQLPKQRLCRRRLLQPLPDRRHLLTLFASRPCRCSGDPRECAGATH